MVSAQGTAFMYQGALNENSIPANGNYDFEFALFDSLNGGAQVGATLQVSNVVVTDGSFSVTLDFGAQFPGTERFLEIRVRQSTPLNVKGETADLGSYSVLSPRQPINSVPYAVRSLSAGSADSATTAASATTSGTADTATNALNLGGVAANQFVLTNDPRLSDDRAPTPGSADYIQNSTTEQPSSDFNISGTGTADIFDADTQFNLGGNRILSIAGSNNLLIGTSAGASNSGSANTFVGANAGALNTSGINNSIFGFNAGADNTTGNSNNFFGRNAGANSSNGVNNSFFGSSSGFGLISGQGNSFFGNNSGGGTTTGNLNTFIGRLSGFTNSTGGNNTLLGHSADVGAADLNFATAIGSSAIVTDSNTVQLGRDGLDVVRVGTLGAASPTFLCFNASSEIAACVNVPLTNATAFIQNTTNQQSSSNFNISGTGSANILNAVTQYDLGGIRILSSPGTNNLFAGVGAGDANTSGSNNSFFGPSAGLSNTTGNANSFFGQDAGRDNTTGFSNSFFGQNSGLSNTIGNSNAFFGEDTGASNTTGNANSFFGRNAGFANVSGSENSFFGTFAGLFNTTGARNSFFGQDAGRNTTTGSSNSFFGESAGLANTIGSNNSFFGEDAGDSNTTGALNSFFGQDAGQANTTGNANAFFGENAGFANSTGFDNSFFGEDSGDSNTTGNNNSAFGNGSDFSAIDLVFATVIGADAVVTSSNTVQLGRSGFDVVRIGTTGSAGSTDICLNASDILATCSSSIRYKDNVEPFSGGVDVLNRLRPVTFNWKGSGMFDLGLVAEEVAEIEPLLVTYKNEQVEGVKYDRIGVLLVNVVKEQAAELERQKEEVKGQKAEIESQNERIGKLEKRLADQDKQVAALKALVCAANPGASVCVEEKTKQDRQDR